MTRNRGRVAKWVINTWHTSLCLYINNLSLHLNRCSRINKCGSPIPAAKTSPAKCPMSSNYLWIKPFTSSSPRKYIKVGIWLSLARDQSHKSHNAPVPHPQMHHSEHKCTHFCSEWCIVEYGTCVLWDLREWSILLNSWLYLIFAVKCVKRPCRIWINNPSESTKIDILTRKRNKTTFPVKWDMTYEAGTL